MEAPQYIAPASINDALKLKQQGGVDARVIAGGWDLLLRLKDGVLSPRLLLEMHRDGSLVLHSAAADMGQGIITVMAQLAADRLGLDMASVRVTRADTARAPDAGAVRVERIGR